MRHPGRPLRIAIAAASVVAIALLAPAPAASSMHLRLTASQPAKDTVLAASPAKLQLWFSEAPQLKLSRIRLSGPGGTVPLGPLTADPTDRTRLTAAVTAPLAAGRYVISWRTASSDGHAIKGDIPFTVRPTE